MVIEIDAYIHIVDTKASVTHSRSKRIRTEITVGNGYPITVVTNKVHRSEHIARKPSIFKMILDHNKTSNSRRAFQQRGNETSGNMVQHIRKDDHIKSMLIKRERRAIKLLITLPDRIEAFTP